MKKILHISKYYFPFIGGVEEVAADITAALKGEEYQQKIICFNEDSTTDGVTTHRGETVHDMIDGVEVIRCGTAVKLASQALSVTYFNELKKVMESYRPDIVVFHYPNPFVSQMLLMYKKMDFKLVVYWHLDITKQKVLSKFFYMQNIELLKRADKVIATSPNYIKGSPFLTRFRDKCTVIPNCINNERLKVTPEIEKLAHKIRNKYKGKIICFGLGRHIPYKGFIKLVEASRYLDDRFAILIGGKGELTGSLIKEASGDSKVHFLGKISDSELIACLLACDVFCFPSITKNEAFGIALAEGMYFGKPAVTFTIEGSGVNYVNVKDVTGLECPNSDSRAYAKALEKLASDPELREKLGNAGRERVLENFTYDRFRTRIIDMIEAL
ncbi:rhamnosyl/mannosyltransferase [Ruminococcus sp. YE71]|uniref:glycosyltransferase n=1 Tax=unclassified Ruminococcus TaxID=2608920 RepID=UPI00088CBCC4|nr:MULTISPECIES: glycosyltransferase [unclassified Ruminococcus]SDA30668.1 rhamnosyl/mannosyltransferase [Ruminococcus sp. YE78]SFW49927.1 rhamnosyl/mannosyltransferase [Ruminococcus sp. YE71]